MHALVSFAFGPVGRYVVGGLAVAGVALWLRWDIATDAVRDFKASARAAFSRLLTKADQAQDTVQTCPGTWNREAGRCER
jgi:hypothetical protein